MKLIEIWKRLGKQPLKVTQHTEAIVFINGQEYVISKIRYNNGKFIGFEAEPKYKTDVIKMREATLEEQQSVQKYIDSISKPTGINFFDLMKVENSPCDACPSNLKNGGSGICNCTLGTQVIY